MALSIKTKYGIGSLLVGSLLIPDMLHISFECIEFVLDLLVEQLFHTDRQTTQIIVFYLMLTLLIVAFYRLVRCVPAWYFAGKHHVIESWHRRNAALRNSLRTMPLLNKTTACLGLSFGFAMLILGLIS